MDKSTIVQQMQLQTQFDAQVWQMMMRVKRGETIPDARQYMRVTKMLRERAKFLEANPALPVTRESDWLALAMYGEDRVNFIELCRTAEKGDNPTYNKVYVFLEPIIRNTLETLS